MGYTLRLVDDQGNSFQAAKHYEGGTINIDGETFTEVDVTYNYTPVIALFFDKGSHGMHGMHGFELAPILRKAVAQLGTARADDYWMATPGNVGVLFNLILGWCEQYPFGVMERRG